MKKSIVYDALNSILLDFEHRYFIDGVLDKFKVIEDLQNYNKNLLNSILENEVLYEYFTLSIGDTSVVKVQDLIDVFEMNDYWDDSVTKYKRKIGLITKNGYIDESSKVVLHYPYKDSVLKADMSESESTNNVKEPYYNTIIDANEIDVMFDNKILVNSKRYSEDGERLAYSFEDDDNLIIKGNNLIALHSLKDRFGGKVKLITIDPPYFFKKNKKSDTFKYNSNFKLSTWLVFMRNRIEVAMDLLSNDGVLMVMIGEEGAHYLQVMLDEMFDVLNHPDRFKGKITWRKTDNQSNTGDFANVIDYILIYTKNDETKLNKLPLTDKAKKNYSYEDEKGHFRREVFHHLSRGKYFYDVTTPKGETISGPWMIEESDFREREKKEEIYWPEGGNQTPYGKIYLADSIENGQVTSDFWGVSYGTNQRAADEMKELFGYRAFEFPKSERVMMNLLSLGSQSGDLVMDFFMGSSTTIAVALKMGRRFIGIEQMDYINTISIPRLQKVIAGEQGGISADFDWKGGGSFVYTELMSKYDTYIEKIVDATSNNQLRESYNSLVQSGGIDFDVELNEIYQMLKEDKLSLERQKEILLDSIDQNQKYQNFSDIDDTDIQEMIKDNDYSFNKSFYLFEESEQDE